MVRPVLLVDDNVYIRRSIRRLFEAEPDFEVIAEAEHGKQAIEKALKHEPHLIVLDLSMPVMNGLEATRILRKNHPEVCIIMLTLYSAEALEVAARKLGVNGFVTKHKANTDLVSAARALLDSKKTATNGRTAVA